MDLQKTVWAIFLLSSALSATATFSRPWWTDFAQRAYCKTPGEVRCSSDCSEVQICLRNNTDGEYNPVTMITCNVVSGMACSARNKTCVPADKSECHPAEDPFICHATGSFPDPFDCKKFHVCFDIGEESERGSCSDQNDDAYNPLTADCTLTTSDRVCTEGPIKSCSGPLEVGVVPENQAIYYVCKPSASGYYPDMYRCPGGTIFDVSLFSCVESATTTTQPPSPPVTPPPTESPPATLPPEGGSCSTPLEAVADPYDCQRYYQCIDGTWYHGHCIDDYHFDSQEMKCVYGPCPVHRD